jgi:hypothetical protein
MPHAGDVDAEGGRSDVGESSFKRAADRRLDRRLKCRQDTLPVGLAEGNESHAGRDQVCGDGVQEGGRDRFERDAMSGRRDADGDRMGEGPIPDLRKPPKRRARPGGPRRVEDAARWACARNAVSQKPLPCSTVTASQRCNVAASLMSFASTAHSIPLE